MQLGVAVQAIEAHEQLEAEPFDEAEQPDRETLGAQRTAPDAPAGELQTQATEEKADRAGIKRRSRCRCRPIRPNRPTSLPFELAGRSGVRQCSGRGGGALCQRSAGHR